MLAAVPTGMSAAFREISTLTLPDSAVDAAIAPHNYTGNVSRICGGLMRARSESQGVLSTVAHEPARFARKEVLLQCSIRPTEPQPNALNATKVKVLSVVGC